MAVNRVLTSDEKFSLLSDSRFQNLCRQAIYDKSVYWTGQDGSTPPGNDRMRWAKSRFRSQGIVVNPSQINGNVSQQFIIFLKNINLWDSAVNGNVVVNSTVNDYMVSSGVFDTLADNWMDEAIRGIDF